MNDRLYSIITAHKNDKSIACRYKTSTITYSELFAAAENYAELLRRQGTGPILIYESKSIEMYVSIIACILAGRTYIPVDSSTPVFRLEKIISLAKPDLIISNEKIINNIRAKVISLNQLTQFRDLKINPIDINNPAYMIFTSGTTGVPKGVPISRDNLYNFIVWINLVFPPTKQKLKVLNTAVFSFDLSVVDIFYSLNCGHELVILPSFDFTDSSALFSLIKDEQINAIVATPTFIDFCLLNPEFDYRHFVSLRIVYLCGEVLEKSSAAKLLARFPDIKLINAYGPTEATSAVCACLIDQTMIDDDKSLPVGNLSDAAVDIQIIDQEIVLKGQSVFSGYLGDTEKKYFINNETGEYKTGDYGYIFNGRLYFTGRKDDQFKYKGYRIELRDIESNITSVSGVTGCAVVRSLARKNKVRSIKAYVTIDDTYDQSEVEKEIRSRLPSYMIPKKILFVAKLPVNANGKIDREVLKNDD